MFMKRFRLSTDEAFALDYSLGHRWLLFAEGDGGEGGEGGAGGGGAEGGDGEGQEGEGGKGAEAGSAEGSAAADAWREPLSDDAKKFAESSPDVEHLVGRALDMQKKLSTAIFVPGKDATPEEMAAYDKKMGVPESAEDYEFTAPEGEPTDADKAFQTAAAEIFHTLKIPADKAKALSVWWNEFSDGLRQAQIDADKAHAEETDAALHKLWPGEEYDRNMAFAERAAERMFGDDLQEVRKLETRSGRFVLDIPMLSKALAAVGREMAEGGLVPPMSENELEQADDQLSELRGKIAAAQEKGDNKLANRLYKQEQALIAKTRGSQPIVGAQGRAA